MSHTLCAKPRPAAKYFYTGASPAAQQKFLIRGVTYGTFAPSSSGGYPELAQLRQDFALMRDAGVNTLRVYTEPPRYLLDEAARHGLHVIVGLAWTQHVCFLDDDALVSAIRASVRDAVKRLHDHPAVLAFALGNEIPQAIVRWHGKAAIEAFLHQLYRDVKREAPDALCTYVNYPPTDYLELPFLDFVSFNVFLHELSDFRAYVSKLQHIAGNQPLVLTELGMDSVREGEQTQAELLRTHVAAAFADGAAGACVFSFTDDWWRGGSHVTDWSFGVVDRQRQPKPAYAAVQRVFQALPFSAADRARFPKVSVVICAYNAATTLEDNLASLSRLDYPDYEVIVVDDGSTDATLEIARRYPFRVISVPNGGLSAARNLGLQAACGDIVAYTDADTRVDRDWLSHLVQPFLESSVAGVGGPNVVPADDPWVAQCVARSPGGPVHVMLDNIEAEHIPGCNMAFRREALLEVGGFDPTYTKAGDDVDICWRLQAHGHKLAFAPGALVWHHHRSSVKAFLRQQVGYGEGETFLLHRHTDRFNERGHTRWSGRIYSALPAYRSLFRQVVYQGRFGAESFPSSQREGLVAWRVLPAMIEWQLLMLLLMLASLLSASPRMLAVAVTGFSLSLFRSAHNAWRSKLDDVVPSRRIGTDLRYRALITVLHVLQPWARLWGRMKGQLGDANLSPAGKVLLEGAGLLGPLPSLKLMLGGLDETFWDTQYTPLDSVRMRLHELAAGALTPVRVHDGYEADYDFILRDGSAFAFRLKLTAEDHGGMNRLLRARIALARSWSWLGALMLALGLVSASLLNAGLWAEVWLLPMLALSVSLLCFVLYRVSVYGGQVVHALRQACLQTGIQVVTRVVTNVVTNTPPTREPDQHTVLS